MYLYNKYEVELERKNQAKHNKEIQDKHKAKAKHSEECCRLIVFDIGVAIFRQLVRRYVDCAALTDEAQVPPSVSYGEYIAAAITYLEGNLLGGTVKLGKPTQHTSDPYKHYTGVMLIHRLTLSKMYC